MNTQKGAIVYYGSKSGVIIRKQGPHAVQVRTSFCRSVQDFLTGKITEVSGMRLETWPIAKIKDCI